MNGRGLEQALVQTPVRTALGLVFALAISRQLIFGGSHVAIWFGIYGSWAAALVVLFVMSRGEDDDDGVEIVEDSEDRHV
jgi:hypothetical protein